METCRISILIVQASLTYLRLFYLATFCVGLIRRFTNLATIEITLAGAFDFIARTYTA